MERDIMDGGRKEVDGLGGRHRELEVVREVMGSPGRGWGIHCAEGLVEGPGDFFSGRNGERGFDGYFMGYVAAEEGGMNSSFGSQKMFPGLGMSRGIALLPVLLVLPSDR